MLTKVILENFESHKRTEIHFVQGTNVIIGESDAGKSSIFRAIYWVVTNRPLGDTFRSHWGGDTRVALFFDEGSIVERIKSPSRNQYVVNGKVLSAVGTEVPEEVTQILQFDLFNIQSQFDPSFLLANTPGEASRILNKAATIDDIDVTISNINSSISKTKSDLAYDEKELEKYQKAIEEYDNLDEIESFLEKVEQQEQKLKSLEQKWYELDQLILEIEDIQYQIDMLKSVPELLEKLEAVESWYAELRRRITQYHQLHQLMEEITTTVLELEATKNVDKALALLRKVEEIYTAIANDKIQYKSLEEIIKGIRLTQKAIQNETKAIIALENEYEQLAPDTCPLCGAEMKKEDKHA